MADPRYHGSQTQFPKPGQLDMLTPEERDEWYEVNRQWTLSGQRRERLLILMRDRARRAREAVAD
jgi:hypothetical protein